MRLNQSLCALRLCYLFYLQPPHSLTMSYTLRMTGSRLPMLVGSSSSLPLSFGTPRQLGNVRLHGSPFENITPCSTSRRRARPAYTRAYDGTRIRMNLCVWVVSGPTRCTAKARIGTALGAKLKQERINISKANRWA